MPGNRFPYFSKIWRRDERYFFDDDYYRAIYADVAIAHLDRFTHFMTHGWKEGRDPSAGFTTLYYRDKHLAGQRVNPLTHYVRTGRRQGLETAPASNKAYAAVQYDLVKDLFVRPFYRDQVADIDGDPLLHYLLHGWKEERCPSPDFDPQQYIAAHQYIQGMDVCPLYHCGSQARFEGSAPAKVEEPATRKRTKQLSPQGKTIENIIAQEFDAEFYLRQNEDVRIAGNNPLEHFVNYGWREDRMPNPLFDCAFYLDSNPDVAEQGTNPFYHYLTVGRALGLRANPIGSRLYEEMTPPSEADWREAASAADVRGAECIVIMPVYKGLGETLASIHSILAARQKTKFALHVIDDHSPDPELVDALQRLAALGLFHLVTNATNLGFVKSVNSALRCYPDQDVVLINTDAKVFGDWLDRIVAHAARDPEIATITPFTNNATIFSYPLVNHNNMIEMEHDAAGLDRLAAFCNAGRVSDAPVGVGFCLFVSAASRAVVGLLDEEAFGRGYGEENDFCLRAAKAGFRNVLAEDVFVYHVGEVSFGAPDKTKSAPGQAALLAKHPEYPELIRQHLMADATEEGRLRLDLQRLCMAAGPAPVVFVYHSLTGGIITHITHEEERLREAGTNVIHIRVGAQDRWCVEVHSGTKPAPFCPNLRKLSVLQARPLLVDFLRWLSPRLIHVHSLVGFDWHATTAFLDLVQQSGVPYHFTLHDYSVVCHRNDLIQPNGRFCELPDVTTCRACVAGDRSYPEGIDPAIRRATFSRFLKGAAQVLAPSRDIKLRLEAAGADYPIVVQPHSEAKVFAPTLTKTKLDGVANIVTFGAIGIHKGSRVILSLARDAKARGLPVRYHVVGYSDTPLDMRAAGVIETGLYASTKEAFEQAVAIEPSCVFLPSIWPETYCYTLSMAFALRCMPVVFDIGAQAERVRDAEFGFILPYRLMDDIKGLNDKLIDICAIEPQFPAGPSIDARSIS